MYLGDLLCRVQCLCETVSVYVQGRDHGYQSPGPLTIRVCVCVYLLWTLFVLRSVYASCCGVSLGHCYFFACTDVTMTNWTLLDGDLPPPICPTPNLLSCFLLHDAQRQEQTRRQKTTGLWNFWCPNDSSIKSINTPVGCVSRYLRWRN